MIHIGDCREVMAAMDAESVDAIVTDPPYELTANKKGGSGVASVDLDSPYGRSRIGTGNGGGGFMGMGWDATGVSFSVDTWAAAYRVLKPGGHLLTFGGTRTFHRIAVAIEDAGFEIRDCLSWLYGSGFPKSLDVSKAIDKAAGAEREVVGERDTYTGNDKSRNTFMASDRIMSVTAPATPEAEQWAGWGTALKPAWEPIIMARKPLIGTVAANVLQHGTGAINVDGCRIGHVTVDGGNLATNPHLRSHINGGNGGNIIAHETERRVVTPHQDGRWPANVALDEEAAAMLDAQSGDRPGCKTPSSAMPESKFRPNQGQYMQQWPIYPDTGGASRFFYVAKASRSERNKGLTENCIHPTVKPVSLMQWLVRMVTPPNGIVLDPFMGSGTTGIAAAREGFRFIGIEQDETYAEIARRRIEGDAPLLAGIE